MNKEQRTKNWGTVPNFFQRESAYRSALFSERE